MQTMETTADRTTNGLVRRLFYRGPSSDVLHEEYAKAGRIDRAAAITACHEVLIDAPVERVWELLRNANGWPAVNPAIRDVHLDAGVAVDARFTWVNGRTRLKSRFAVVDPGRELTWTGLAFGAKVVHRHVLESTGDGRTRLFSEESMAGPLLVLVFSSTKLRSALDKWLTAVMTAAEV